MLGKNYILLSIASVTLLYFLTVQTTRLVEEKTVSPAPSAPDSVAYADWTTTPVSEEDVLVQLDSLVQAIRSEFMPGSSALQLSMEPSLVQLVALMKQPRDYTFAIEFFEADLELARERTEHLRTRLLLYGLPGGSLRIVAREGPAGHRIERISNT